mmetsp:Transcript_13233/g.13048  ORF Transcript_13233/g.13048 Transcript_13233/m.13048 type:complete len:87 (+) Transcript_13233:475-735(+)
MMTCVLKVDSCPFFKVGLEGFSQDGVERLLEGKGIAHGGYGKSNRVLHPFNFVIGHCCFLQIIWCISIGLTDSFEQALWLKDFDWQ